MITRRQIIKSFAGAGIYSAMASLSNAQETPTLTELLGQNNLTEVQGSDPDVSESITLPASDIGKASQPTRPLEAEKSKKELALRMLEISKRYAGHVSRTKNSEQVLEYLGLFGFEDVNTAYCASGISYIAARAFCDLEPTVGYDPEKLGLYPSRLKIFKQRLQEVRRYYFMPSPLVSIIKADAQARNPTTWVGRETQPEPGWLIIFSWNGRTANHIGIVENNEDQIVNTIEYNTSILVNGDQRNGGVVDRRRRPKNNSILGYVRLY